MNEEANFCDQCGSKINSGAKFCSNCGHNLKNSSTKVTLDKSIKVEVTDVTAEKGFKEIEKGFKAIEKTWKPDKGFKEIEKTGKPDLETPYIIDDGCPNCGTSINKEINFNNCWVIDTSTCPRCKSPLPEKLKSILRDQHSKKRLESQPSKSAHSGMTIAEIIKSLVFYVLMPFAYILITLAVVIGVVSFVVSLL
jgi:hypothetical protein